MSRPLLPPRPSGVFPAGFPVWPQDGPALWNGLGGGWERSGWEWLARNSGGVQRVDVYMAEDRDGATLVVRLLDRRYWVAVYADRDVLADALRSRRSLRLARESTAAAVVLLRAGGEDRKLAPVTCPCGYAGQSKSQLGYQCDACRYTAKAGANREGAKKLRARADKLDAQAVRFDARVSAFKRRHPEAGPR